MGRSHAKDTLKALSCARKVIREPCAFSVVHPPRAVIRELSTRLLGALARFAPLRLGTLLRFAAHDRRLYLSPSGP
jgi:hypothetical protein